VVIGFSALKAGSPNGT